MILVGKKKCSIFFGLAVGIINFSSGTCPETGYIRISHCYLSASMFFFTEAFGIETSAVEAVNHFESFWIILNIAIAINGEHFDGIQVIQVKCMMLQEIIQ